jgi:hypothetical protein
VGGGHGQPPLSIQHHHHRYHTTQCFLDGWNSFKIKKNFLMKMYKIKFWECDKAKRLTYRVLKLCSRMFTQWAEASHNLCMLKKLNSAADQVCFPDLDYFPFRIPDLKFVFLAFFVAINFTIF